MDEKNRQRLKSIAAVLAVLAALIFVGVRWGGPVVRLVSDPQAFRAWVGEKGAWGPLIMIACITMQILVALIPGEPFEFAAGYAFGAWRGMALCMVGSLVGGALAMLLARRFGRRLIQSLFPKTDIDSLPIFKNQERLRLLTFLLFLIPGTPKDVLIYALGLTPMSVPEAMILTTVARIPSILTSTLSGHALGEQQYAAAVVIYGLTGLVSLIAILIYRRRSKGAS